MAQFDLAFSKISKLEPHPTGDGGEGLTGASLRWVASVQQLKGLLSDKDANGAGAIELKDVLPLRRDEQAALYHREWWQRYGYGMLDPQPLAERVFALAMTVGAVPASKLVQRAINAHMQAVQGSTDIAVMNDTRRAIRYVCSRESANAFIATLRAEHAAYYREVVAANPKLREHLPGWLAIAYQ